MAGEWSGRWGVWHLLPLGKGGGFIAAEGLWDHDWFGEICAGPCREPSPSCGICAPRRPLTSPLGCLKPRHLTVMVGQPCRYVIRIANVSENVWDVKLTVEISPLAPQIRPAGHYARFTKRLTVPPRRTTRIEVDYDWLTKVDFMLSDIASPRTNFGGARSRYQCSTQ